METFLPALIIIGGVIYKIYTEYQKEQEKARRRRPNIPAVPPIPVPAQATKTPKSMFPKPLPAVPKPRFEKPALPTEVTMLQQQRKQKKQAKIAVETPKIEVLKEPTVNFDLRQAVIQSVILERPYA